MLPYDSQKGNKMDDDIFFAGMKVTPRQNETNQATLSKEISSHPNIPVRGKKQQLLFPLEH